MTSEEEWQPSAAHMRAIEAVQYHFGRQVADAATEAEEAAVEALAALPVDDAASMIESTCAGLRAINPDDYEDPPHGDAGLSAAAAVEALRATVLAEAEALEAVEQAAAAALAAVGTHEELPTAKLVEAVIDAVFVAIRDVLEPAGLFNAALCFAVAEEAAASMRRIARSIMDQDVDQIRVYAAALGRCALAAIGSTYAANTQHSWGSEVVAEATALLEEEADPDQ